MTQAPASVLWDPLQHELLKALGLSPYGMASAGDIPQQDAVGRPSGSAPMRRDASSAQDALLQAVLRAAGGTVSADMLVQRLALPPMQALHGDASAKRRLWPQLRAMRRTPRA